MFIIKLRGDWWPW